MDTHIKRILSIFTKVLGVEFEHFPEKEDMRELWQYDGGLDGMTIQVTPYENTRGVPSVWAVIEKPFPGGSMDVWGQPIAAIDVPGEEEDLEKTIMAFMA